MIENFRNFIDPKDFSINIYKDKINIKNYKKIITLGINKIIIKLDNLKITLNGNNFSLTKLKDEELLITGKLESLEMKYE